jgi:hypothetical protein
MQPLHEQQQQPLQWLYSNCAASVAAAAMQPEVLSELHHTNTQMASLNKLHLMMTPADALSATAT